MKARVGRPPKEVTKNQTVGFRFSQETIEKLKKCAEELNITRTAVIEKGIDLVYETIKK